MNSELPKIYVSISVGSLDGKASGSASIVLGVATISG